MTFKRPLNDPRSSDACWYRKAPAKPRRLAAVSLEQEGRERNQNLFEIDPYELLTELNHRPIVRPLPAVHTMLTTAPQRRVTKKHKGRHEKQDGNGINDNDVDPQREAELRTGSDMPLLKQFLERIEVRKRKKGTKDENATAVRAIDGSACSADGNEQLHKVPKTKIKTPLDTVSTILTVGHHQKFKELLEIFGNNKNGGAGIGIDGGDKGSTLLSYRNRIARKKEFRTLCSLFREERDLYSAALEQFLLQHSDRFYVGFKTNCPASGFVGIKSKYINLHKKRWEGSKSKPAKVFGKCIQTISFNAHAHGHTHSASAATFASPPIIGTEMFSPQIVYGEQDDKCTPEVYSIPMENIVNSLEKKTLRPQEEIVRLQPDHLIFEDEKAKELALEYGADIVTSANVMEILIRSKKWNIPLLCASSCGIIQLQSQQDSNTSVNIATKREKGIVFIEDPVPTPSNPRECLSIGITEALYGQTFRSNGHEGGRKGRYVYTLLTLSRRTGIAKVKVLVRSVNYLYDAKMRPVVLQGQIEYFSEFGYGLENIHANDRAWWFMLRALQPNCRLMICRVNSTTAAVLELEEKSVADAIISYDPVVNERGLNSLGRFEQEQPVTNLTFERQIQSMIEFFFATMTFERDDYWSMISQPPRGDTILKGCTSTFASVHKEINHSGDIPVTDRRVDLDYEWERGKAVFLNEADFHGWVWSHDRIAYTFPLQRGIKDM